MALNEKQWLIDWFEKEYWTIDSDLKKQLMQQSYDFIYKKIIDWASMPTKMTFERKTR